MPPARQPLPHDLDSFALYALDLVFRALNPAARISPDERDELRDFDGEPRAQRLDDRLLIGDHQPQQAIGCGASESVRPMSETERDLMFQTGLRQLASQRADDARPLVKSVVVVTVRAAA